MWWGNSARSLIYATKFKGNEKLVANNGQILHISHIEKWVFKVNYLTIPKLII